MYRIYIRIWMVFSDLQYGRLIIVERINILRCCNYGDMTLNSSKLYEGESSVPGLHAIGFGGCMHLEASEVSAKPDD